MPNLKIYVDEALLPACRTGLTGALPPLRDLLCAALQVDVAACQFAVLPVMGMPDLPRVNAEMHVMPHPDRTRARLLSLAEQVQTMISAATGTHTAVRITTLTPDGYIALK